MKLLIVSNVTHALNNNQYFGYAPYVREMNIWLKYTDQAIILGPLLKNDPTAIEISYKHNNIDFRKVPNFSFTSFKNNLVSLFKLPILFYKIFIAMKDADHIHLRCPGNIASLGCVVQIFFPYKKKTAKYAGNWDSKSKQPWTYKLQKYILNNTFLTKNMQVLVYGEWENLSKNIKPFFTATYSEFEKEIASKEELNPIKFVFVGGLTVGKNPLYAVKIVEQLIEKGNNVVLNLYGEGTERNNLEQYIEKKQLKNRVFLKGNNDFETIKKAYQNNHFVILPSKSEGWPKAIAEGMFWGCIPVATKVSCVPFMLDYGSRGILLEMDLNNDVTQIEAVIKNKDVFSEKSKLSEKWSQIYTLDFFENEIKKLL